MPILFTPEDDKERAYVAERRLCLYPKDLLAAFAGKSGVWLVRSAPARDELGTTGDLAYLEGKFEDVLAAARKIRGFLDENMCGEIVPIRPRRV